MAVVTLIINLLRHRLGRWGVLIVVAFVVVALLAESIAPYDAYDIRERGRRKQSPSAAHWLGTDGSGMDVMSQLVYGTRVSLTVGIVTAVLISLVGAMIGIVAGYMGGVVDTFIMRLADVLFSIPGLPLMIILATYLGTSFWTIIVIFTVLGWAGLARIVRSRVLSLAHVEYIEAAHSYGASRWRIMWRHILPAVSSLVVVNGVMMAAGMMLAEAGLSFLGFGDPRTISWGKILAQAQAGHAALFGMWWWIVPPGAAIFLAALGFMLIGLALEEQLNPYLRRARK
jgi:ABC-type dipeptide/oligopeptide/nickel transport system permease subunit